MGAAAVAGAVAVAAALTGCARAGRPARAPLEPDRPGFATGASIVAPGTVLVEVGDLHRHGAPRAALRRAHVAGEAMLRLPAGRGTELRVDPGAYEIEHGRAGRVAGRTDGALGVKRRVAERGPLSLALLVEAWLPTGSRALGRMPSTGDALLLADVALPGRLALTLNGGAALSAAPAVLDVASFTDEAPGAPARRLVGRGSVALTRTLGAGVAAYGELHRAGVSAGDVGVTWRVGPDLQLDAWLGRALPARPGERQYGFGVSWRR